MTEPVPIGRQIGILVQEQTTVERWWRDAVARRRMRQAEMDYLVESYGAAITTLEWVRDNADTIRRVHESLQNGEETL